MSQAHRVHALTTSGHLASMAAAALAALALVGWSFGISCLQSLHPGFSAMTLVTALSLILASLGVSLYLAQEGMAARGLLGRILAGALVLFCVVKLAEFSLGRQSGGFSWGLGAGIPTGSMAPLTALCLATLGAGLLLGDLGGRRARKVSEGLILGTGTIALMVLFGYAFGAPRILQGTVEFAMALNTALALTLLCLAALCTRPESGLMELVTREGPGRHLLLRLVPAILLAPLLLGWLRLQGQRMGLYDTWFGVTLMVTLMVAFLLGITWWSAVSLDRKEVERDLALDDLRRANRELAQADRHKDEFLAVVSHELRTPLNCIIGFESLLEEGDVGALTATQREYLGKIGYGAHQMQGLVDNLLDMSRITTGKLTLHPREVVYSTFVEQVVSTLRPRAESHRIALETAADVGFVCLDDGRIAQVLTNLLDNALKFTPPGGRIRLVASRPDGWVRTEVSDTGPGIPRAEREHIFDPFRQVDMSATRQSGGLGLGLSICRAIVQAHGGRIGVEDAPGGGSMFWFTLPQRPG